MKRNHTVLSLLGLAALALTLLAAAPASAATTAVQGTITSLSSTARTVTVRSAAGTQSILRTNAASKLSRNGASVSLADLALRDTVSVRFDAASASVLDLRASGPAVQTVRGVLAGVTANGNGLSVVTLHGARAFRLGSTSLITRNGRPASADDLRRGDALLIHATLAAGVAVAKDVAADGPDEDEVEGTITAISGKDVTITPEGGTAVTVHVDDHTSIALCDHGCQAATLADLAVNQQAEAEFDPVSLIATRIKARAPEHETNRVRGTISAVDTTAKTLTVHPATGSDVTVTVDSSTRISLDDAPAALGDLTVGTSVEVAFDPATLVASKIVAGGENGNGGGHAHQRQVEGRVTAIAADTLTVAPERGAPVALKLDATTQYFLRGKPAMHDDVKVGDHVHVSFDVTTSLAKTVRDQGASTHPELSNISGKVSAVSASSITIHPEHGADATLKIDSTTLIFVQGHTAAATDIVVGNGAEAKFDPATLVAKVIRVENEDDQH
jgi:hypothetical protein